jgi:hypothetical protein
MKRILSVIPAERKRKPGPMRPIGIAVTPHGSRLSQLRCLAGMTVEYDACERVAS